VTVLGDTWRVRGLLLRVFMRGLLLRVFMRGLGVLTAPVLEKQLNHLPLARLLQVFLGIIINR